MIKSLVSLLALLAASHAGEEKCCEGELLIFFLIVLKHMLILVLSGACPVEGDAKFYSIVQVNTP